MRVPSPLRGLAVALAAASLGGALAGCQVKNSGGDAANGKKLYVQKCGSCHVLRRAASTGTTGPNLDEAFVQDRRDKFPSSTIRGVVQHQILYPNRSGVMPAKLVKGQDALDVATYVAQVAGQPGQDTGAVANAVQATKKIVAKESGGKLEIDADPTGQLAFVASAAQASPGSVTLSMLNKSQTPHNISIKGAVNADGPTVSGGKVSTLKVTLKPGTYTFYCSVPGHYQGMHGPLTVK
jgi:uncharacterized cupredoxin-like copper-binding protein